MAPIAWEYQSMNRPLDGGDKNTQMAAKIPQTQHPSWQCLNWAVIAADVVLSHSCLEILTSLQTNSSPILLYWLWINLYWFIGVFSGRKCGYFFFLGENFLFYYILLSCKAYLLQFYYLENTSALVNVSSINQLIDWLIDWLIDHRKVWAQPISVLDKEETVNRTRLLSAVAPWSFLLMRPHLNDFCYLRIDVLLLNGSRISGFRVVLQE